jgi:hypothetical protein
MGEFGWAYVSGGVKTPGGIDNSIQTKNSSEFSGSDSFVFDGNSVILTGSLIVSGTVFANEYSVDVVNRNVSNIFVTGSTSFGNTSDDFHKFTGSILVSGGVNLVSISSGTATTSSYLALDSSNNVVLTSSSGGAGGTIGAAEDAGGYGDGLFTDFTISTAIGTPIDRFNEVLKILSPTPSPNVSRITGSEPSGVTAKLSFGSSKVVTDYTSSGTAAGFNAVDAVGIYSASVSGSNFRLGIYDGTQDVTGAINYHVVDSITNGYMAYSNNSFGNANEGTLKLELNGTVIHTASLSGFTGAGNPNSGSGTSLTGQTGFIATSVTASSYDGNNSEWYIFKYRTAKYKIAAGDQKVGWNYARVVHTLTSDNETNYVEWINDPSGAAGIANMSASGGRIEDIVLSGEKYLSGVKYNTDATAKYKVDLLNLYSNVYASSGTPISFATANSSVPSSQAVSDLGGSDDRSKILGVTASLDFNGSTLFNGAITCNTTVTHPLKSTISTTGSATTGNGFLIDNRSLSSTNLEEKFHDETYRKTSGSYNAQSSATASISNWNSQIHMTGSNIDGHQDGLLFHNQRLYSPVDGDIPNGGDFKAMSNASGSSQPDYVNDTPLGTRTYYRIITNSSGVTKRDMKIVSTKSGTKYNNLTLNSSNTHFFAKIPGSTGWMDISQPFNYGSSSDSHGALLVGANSNSNTGSTDSANSTHCFTFGTQSVSNDEYIMIKLVADESWGGYLTEMSFSFGAGTGSAVEPGALDNIDLDDTAGIDAKLSFGSSNSIDGYTNAQGSGKGSMDNYNSNENYSDNNSTRRGVFKAVEIMGGTLNEDISASGSNYTTNSFKDAYTGSLLLIVNDTTASTLDLMNLEANNNLSSNTGFSIGSVGFSTTFDGITDYTKPYRTGTYSIGTGQQRSGWNHTRVIHKIGGTETTTNYVEWVVDPSGSTDNTSVSTPILSDFGHTNLYYQSGIGYYATSPTASFSFSGSNFYSNVYQNGTAVSFPSRTNCTVSNIRIIGPGIDTYDASVSSANMPDLNDNTDCETTHIQVTGTLTYNGSTPSISGGLGLFTVQSASSNGQILHPFKTNGVTSTLAKSNIFVYSGSISNGTTNSGSSEDFNVETYRIVSSSYLSQSNVTSSSNIWNSQTAMNNGGTHDDGLVTINGYLISPFQIGVSGNTGHASLQAPAGNPNYSTLTNATRSYYRYFKNTGGSTIQNFNLFVTGNASIVGKNPSEAHYGVLANNNRINIELKIPYEPVGDPLDDRSTAWADAAVPQGGTDPTVDGYGCFNGGNGNLDQDASDGSNIAVTFGTKEWKSNGYLVMKISAHKDWNGYISSVTASY